MPFAALAGAAVLGTVASTAGSIIGGQQQAGAAKHATDAQLQMFNTEQQTEAPFVNAGSNALKQIMDGMAGFNAPFDWSKYTQSPGYQFELEQGKEAVTNSAAGRGGIFGGNTLKALDQFGIGTAAQDYGNQRALYDSEQQAAFDRLFAPAQLGQAAAANVGAGAINTGQGVANTILQGGNARSAQTGGVSNSLVNFLNTPGLMDLLLQQSPSGGSFGGGLGSPLASFGD